MKKYFVQVQAGGRGVLGSNFSWFIMEAETLNQETIQGWFNSITVSLQKQYPDQNIMGIAILCIHPLDQ